MFHIASLGVGYRVEGKIFTMELATFLIIPLSEKSGYSPNMLSLLLKWELIPGKKPTRSIIKSIAL